MTEIEDRINGNANWREDTGKTAAAVATEMNAAKAVLNPGSRYTLIGLVKNFGVEAASLIEFKVRAAAKSLGTGDLSQQVQAVALDQLLDSLRIGDGPDFGAAQTQAAIDSLRGVLSDEEISGLKSLGVVRSYTAVTEDDVKTAWQSLSSFWSRQTTAANAQRLANSLGSYLEDGTQFDAVLTQLKAL